MLHHCVGSITSKNTKIVPFILAIGFVAENRDPGKESSVSLLSSSAIRRLQEVDASHAFPETVITIESMFESLQ